jgi:hypothetical protein
MPRRTFRSPVLRSARRELFPRERYLDANANAWFRRSGGVVDDRFLSDAFTTLEHESGAWARTALCHPKYHERRVSLGFIEQPLEV